MEYSAPTFLLILFFIIPLFIKLLKHNDSTKKSKKPRLPPGPKPWPIVGNIPEMLANKPTFRWIQNIMNDLETEIACIRLGNIHVILVTSPSIAREFFVKQDAIFASRPLNWSSKYVSSGYLTTTITPFGEQWKKMKRVMVEELISPKRHQWLHDKRAEEADNLVRHVYNQTKNGGGLVDLRNVTKQYGGNLMRRLLFNKRYFGNGREDGGAGAVELEYVESLFIAIRHIYAFSVSDYLPWLWWLDFEGHKKILKEATNTIRKYHDPIIEERIHQWRNGTRAHQEDWLDVLISLKDANNNPFLTLQEIKSQIMEIAVGAIDNPYNNVEWVLSEMINQPEMLQKATQELDSVVGKERLVEESDIPKLNYVKACLKEGFRLHPIADFNVPHVSMEDTIVANYFIPKGSHILVRRQGIGHNPRVWEEPLKFKPERHLKNDACRVTLAEPNLELFTFGIGRRSCPAITLGSTMTIMLFARLVHGFTWIAPPNESTIDLSEYERDTTKAKPLVALGKPRLSVKSPTILDIRLGGEKSTCIYPTHLYPSGDGFKSDPKREEYQTGRGAEQGGIGFTPSILDNLTAANPPLRLQVSNEVNEPSQAPLAIHLAIPLAVPHCRRSVTHLAIQLTKHTATVAHQPSSPSSRCSHFSRCRLTSPICGLRSLLTLSSLLPPSSSHYSSALSSH
ncbi:hypothetical protein S83_000543 [Arachis hypogaea]